MRGFQRVLTIFGSALVALSLGAAQPAKAGDGADLGSLQNLIDDVCTNVFFMSSCPQVPTIAQGILQIAAMLNVAPEAVRSSTFVAVPVGPNVDAGNPSRPPALGCLGLNCVDPLNPITGLPIDPAVLSSLRPLAFVSAGSGNAPAKPTQPYDPSANAFLYAVGGLSAANSGSPGADTLVLFYDDPGRTSAIFKPGQVVATMSLPLTVLNNDAATERFVPAILQFKASTNNTAPCSASTVTGNFTGSSTQSIIPSAIGINCAVVFAASPVSSQRHAIFEVTVPILITSLDSAITTGSLFNLGSPFSSGEPGFTPVGGVLGTTGMSIGIAPNAAPFGAPATITSPGTYALCANLPLEGNGLKPLPSVAAFYAIGGDGEVRVSAPLAAGVPIICPAGL